MSAFLVINIKRVSCGAKGYKYSQRKMRRDGLSEAYRDYQRKARPR